MMRLASVLVLAMAFAAAEGFGAEGLKMSMTLSAPAEGAVAPPHPGVPRSTARDYRIGEDDLLEIQVFGVEQLSRTVRVNARGLISLPLVGPLQVAGMTAQEAESLVTQKLAESYLQNPQVSLFIKEFTTQRVTIEGAVNRPGIYPLRGQSTLLTSLALAGGQAALSDMSEVMLFRTDASGKRVARQFDVEKIRRGELDDPSIVNDDLIVVNRSRSRTVLRDSLLRDVIDTVNPFRWGAPAP